MYRDKVSDSMNCAIIQTMLRQFPDIHVDGGDPLIINELAIALRCLEKVHLFYLKEIGPKDEHLSERSMDNKRLREELIKLREQLDRCDYVHKENGRLLDTVNELRNTVKSLKESLRACLNE